MRVYSGEAFTQGNPPREPPLGNHHPEDTIPFSSLFLGGLLWVVVPKVKRLIALTHPVVCQTGQQETFIACASLLGERLAGPHTTTNATAHIMNNASIVEVIDPPAPPEVAQKL